VTVEYLDLADYVAVAAEVTAIDVATVMKVANLDLADSALHAPAAGVRGDRVLPLEPAVAPGELGDDDVRRRSACVR
jgi:hypothetical protein